MSALPDNLPAPIKTPCIKVCVVDGQSGLCLGCYRKLSEIAGWTKLSEERRDEIILELPARRSLISPDKLAMF